MADNRLTLRSVKAPKVEEPGFNPVRTQQRRNTVRSRLWNPSAGVEVVTGRDLADNKVTLRSVKVPMVEEPVEYQPKRNPCVIFRRF